MIDASSLPLSMVALHNAPRYSREKDYMGFLAKKKKLPGGLTLYFVTQTLFWLVARLILFYMIRSMIRDPVRDPICKLK